MNIKTKIIFYLLLTVSPLNFNSALACESNSAAERLLQGYDFLIRSYIINLITTNKINELHKSLNSEALLIAVEMNDEYAINYLKNNSTEIERKKASDSSKNKDSNKNL